MPAQRTRDTPPQSLEVITDTLQPPALAIVSPTPRAFHFPFHQHDHTPSPTNSPFEPDLRKLTLTPSHRTLSPLSPDSAASSSSASSATSVFSTTSSSPLTTSSTSSFPVSPSHKRRKSSVCSDIERRPKKGDEDYIKRPENAFILFRRRCCEERQLAQDEAAASSVDGPTKKQRQADLSKTISQQWKALSPEERLYWEELAKEKKKEHEQMYPNYVYRPQRSKDRKGKKGKRAGEFDLETDSENTISFVLPFSMPATTAKHGRSVSAPTPPPARQTIQIPAVYMPSCPTSPSLVPMISRRSSHPDHHFDFVPANTAQHHYRSDMFPVDANGFYHGMFENPGPLPLLIPSDDMPMLPPHQMLSPASSIASDSSSGPSSPDAGPFTPTTCRLQANNFSYPSSCDNMMMLPEPQMDASAPAALDSCVQFNYAPSFSSSAWESASASWGEDHHDSLLVGDEFDLNAIPPIELGIPGCSTDQLMTPHASSSSFDIVYASGLYDHASSSSSQMDPSQYSPGESHNSPETFEQLFNFDGMLPVPQGY